MLIFRGPSLLTMFKYFILTIAFLVFLISCSNDVDINDDWNEQAVIYALLDPTDSVQTVRVQKTFLGQGDVYELSEISDSIYYSDEIQVSIQKLDNGNPTGTEFILVQQTVDKLDGDFATDDHVVYVTQNDDGVLDRTAQYRVKVRNLNTGYEAYGDTYLIGEFYLEKPQSPTINFNTTVKLDMEWKHADYAGVYQMVIRFHYEEDGELKSIDMPYTQRQVGVDYSNSGVSEQFEITRFYGFLQNNLEATTTIKRIPKGVELLVYAGGADYTLYTNLNQSSGSLVEERPEFTNVVNGAGLVSSRSFITSSALFLNNPTQDYYQLSLNSIDSLVCGYRTRDLNFGEITVLGNNDIDTTFCN